MIWGLLIGLALLAFVLVVFVLRAPRAAREAVAAALLLGVAGYVAQGSPGQPAAPKAADEPVSADPAALVDARSRVSNKGIPPSNQWVVIADGLARNGRYADAAEVLRGAIGKDPKNSEAWLAMANALLAHSEGTLTPAALYAYRQAAKADPDNPGPPFFLGLALAQAGRFAEARALWAGLLARAPAEAPWREPLAQQLAKLDALLSSAPRGMPDSRVSPP
ncbi:cytochrome c-type biogenesis protein CcmH [Novosphingobium sp. CF614]|uniref:tetratricopeptide repeat protein n=1 Tax=Novosphingobium sp. CF614 TaxID=1884364 RepID=UPI0008E6133A|nr:tetratricopeptide repeat protein [Novosphingobium sp. CF614]SFG17434.1 cytochrome c-type biogenesis protein CcmH [Novosphingobium sp. CF614]